MLLSAVPAASAGPAAESATAMLKGPRTADEENVNDDEFGLNDDYNEDFRPEERDNYWMTNFIFVSSDFFLLFFSLNHLGQGVRKIEITNPLFTLLLMRFYCTTAQFYYLI